MINITDEFKALDAVDFAIAEGALFKVTKNQIIARHRFIPRMSLFCVFTKNMSAETVNDIIDKIFTRL